MAGEQQPKYYRVFVGAEFLFSFSDSDADNVGQDPLKYGAKILDAAIDGVLGHYPGLRYVDEDVEVVELVEKPVERPAE